MTSLLHLQMQLGSHPLLNYYIFRCHTWLRYANEEGCFIGVTLKLMGHYLKIIASVNIGQIIYFDAGMGL